MDTRLSVRAPEKERRRRSHGPVVDIRRTRVYMDPAGNPVRLFTELFT